MLIYPFLEAIATYLKDSIAWTEAGFRRGEAQLQAMNKQLKTLPLYDGESHIYLVDGILKLYGMNDIELFLLETSGPFANTEKPKIAFDHHKGLFGALAMLKTVADMFPLAIIDAFKKSKYSSFMEQVRHDKVIYFIFSLSLIPPENLRVRVKPLEFNIQTDSKLVRALARKFVGDKTEHR